MKSKRLAAAPAYLLPDAVWLKPARFESLCAPCGRMILEGDQITGPYGPTRSSWTHAGCLAALYRAGGRPAPRIMRRHYAPPTTSHAVVNRADAPRCYLCTGRIILGRDGAPITDSGGTRHASCATASSSDPRTLPCGHRAVYARGPLKGLCRACTRQGGSDR